VAKLLWPESFAVPHRFCQRVALRRREVVGLRKPTDQQSQSNVGHQGQKRRIPELLFGYTKPVGQVLPARIVPRYAACLGLAYWRLPDDRDPGTHGKRIHGEPALTAHGGILFVGDEGLPDYLERVRHSCSNHPLRHDSIVWRRLRREWLEPDRNVVARFLENRPTLILGRDPTSGRTS